jgi:hypothetical protein
MTGVLVIGAGVIAWVGAALMIGAGGCIGAALTIDRQQRLRDPRFGVRFVVELRDNALDDGAHVDMNIGLHRDIHVGSVMAG